MVENKDNVIDVTEHVEEMQKEVLWTCPVCGHEAYDVKTNPLGIILAVAGSGGIATMPAHICPSCRTLGIQEELVDEMQKSMSGENLIVKPRKNI